MILLESDDYLKRDARAGHCHRLATPRVSAPMPRYDLHSHSTYSDGLLPPAGVVARAAQRGVDVLALTDHDVVDGLPEALVAARDAGIVLVCGCELSVTWRENTIHVIALRIDPDNATLLGGLASIRGGRGERARLMAEGLAAAGIDGAYEGAMRYVTNVQLVSRTHFARYLVEAGHARDSRDVFDRYLTHGKPGYVPHAWASLTEAIDWIHAAGGQAVLAHPGRYRVSPAGMRKLLSEFADTGGDGIEILSPSHTPAQYAEFATHARLLGLRGSCGTDWHGPGENWMDLGDLPDLPPGVVPIWKDW